MPPRKSQKVEPPKGKPPPTPIPCEHKNSIYQPGYTHKFCPDCARWFPDENHPDNKEENQS